MRVHHVIFSLILAIGMGLGAVAQGAGPSSLRVGAGKVDVTPAQNELPKNYAGILDHLYSRAIVLQSGNTSAALITVDAGVIPDQVWQGVAQQLQKQLGIPAANVLLTATHTHSVPMVPGAGYVQKIVESVKLAKERLTPARVGYGTGVSYLNVNRNIIDPKTRRWWEGPNYEGTSDKTVAVVKFESLGGEPIAVYYNYAMHAVTVGQLDMVSADYPGATSRYIEDSLDDKAVAVFSNGAAGDQNPIYFQQTFDLRDIRIKDYAKRGIDISNAMPPGGEGLDRKDPTVAKLMGQQKEMIVSMGQLLGEEVLHVMRGMERTRSDARIYEGHKAISCPGRERINSGRAGSPGEYKDAAPVEIRLGLLRLGDVVIGAVDAEVFNLIAQRFKRESPYTASMMTTLTNGMARSGYIPNDAAYGMNTFEVVSSRLRPGCAETSIVNGLLDLIDDSDKAE
jgi:Neutral/alkaline non-lysosomal ceramidase, N-terminal